MLDVAADRMERRGAERSGRMEMETEMEVKTVAARVKGFWARWVCFQLKVICFLWFWESEAWRL
jgi:hypothetical protein